MLPVAHMVIFVAMMLMTSVNGVSISSLDLDQAISNGAQGDVGMATLEATDDQSDYELDCEDSNMDLHMNLTEGGSGHVLFSIRNSYELPPKLLHVL